MKSAYELAMERLNKQAPTQKLNAGQKRELAELDSIYAAKTAQLEIGLKGDIAQALENGAHDQAVELDARLNIERKKLAAELEEKKERIRQQR